MLCQTDNTVDVIVIICAQRPLAVRRSARYVLHGFTQNVMLHKRVETSAYYVQRKPPGSRRKPVLESKSGGCRTVFFSGVSVIHFSVVLSTERFWTEKWGVERSGGW